MLSSENLLLFSVLGALLCFALLCSLVYAVFFKKRVMQRAVMRETTRQFTGVPIVRTSTTAFFHGWGRSWDSQWQGYGVLILTQGMLYFRLFERKLDIAIPLERVENTSMSSARKGWSRVRQFHVAYRGKDDQLRTATWIVRRPNVWVHSLQAVVEGMGPDEKAQEEHIPM